MIPELKDIEGLALALPAAKREELAQTLLCSLDDHHLNEVDEAWIEEAERRLQELLEGKVQGISGDQVIPDIRRELG